MTAPSTRLALPVLFLLGLYTDATLGLGSLRIPGALAGFVGLGLVILNLRRIREHHVVYLFLLALLCLVTIMAQMLTSSDFVIRGHFFNQLQSWVLLVFALLAGYGAYLELSEWQRERLAKTLHIAILAILIGSALELYTPFRVVSDNFRQLVYDKSLIYDNDLRDLTAYGQIRVKLFTTEPSHVAKFLFLATSCWLFLSNRGRDYLLFYIYAFAGIFLIRSPILLPLIFVPIALTMSSEGRGRLPMLAFLFFLVTLVVMPLALIVGPATMAPRLESIASGKDASFIVRLAAPLLLLVEVLKDHPVFGLGFGAKEAGLDYLWDVFSRFSAKFLRTSRPDHLGHSFIFLLIVQLGVLGTALFVFLFVRFGLAMSRGRFIPVFFILFCMMNFAGSTNTVRTWASFFIVFGAAACAAGPSRVGESWTSPRGVQADRQPARPTP